MKKTIEIEDKLEDRVQTAIEEVETELINFLKLNSDFEGTPCLNNDLDYSGVIHEIIDSSVPIYTKEIKDTWYLYKTELEESYEDSGIGDNSRENNGMTAIYCYISDKVNEWYQDNADLICEEWREKNKKTE